VSAEVIAAIEASRSFMVAVAYFIVKNRDAAEDISQDSLYNALTRRH
jgi:DNA-directed RNA polymerase specialized sigma24 family protein